MTTPLRKKLLVFGGNGFLGTRICRTASLQTTPHTWEVISLSRSGEPHWPSVSSHTNRPTWAENVTWRKANILDPESYAEDLRGASAVVHTMGILLEADYKGVLTGRESPVAGLRRAFSKTKRGSSRNPLERGEGSPAGLDPGEEDGQITYELMNRDTAISLASSSASANVPTFAYISAAAGAPILPARYITTKREAESTISSSFPSMRSIFIRAPFLYDSSRTFTLGMAAVTFGGYAVNSLTGGNLTWLMGAGGAKPLKADVVAAAVVEGLGDQDVKGPVEVGEIETLAERGWRRGML